MTDDTQRRDDLITELRKHIETRDMVIAGLNRLVTDLNSALAESYEEAAKLRAEREQTLEYASPSIGRNGREVAVCVRLPHPPPPPAHPPHPPEMPQTPQRHRPLEGDHL